MLRKLVDDAIEAVMSVDSHKYVVEQLRSASVSFCTLCVALPDFEIEDICWKLRWSYYVSIGSSQGPHRTLEAERFDAVLRKRGLSELRDKAADFIITVGCLDDGIDGS